MLGRNIYTGERLEKNLKSIAMMSLIIALAGTVMFIMNIMTGAYLVSLTSIAFLLVGIVIYFFTAVAENRRAAMIVTIVSVITVLTYNVLFISNGFAFMWTILVPLAVSYLFGARAGIIVSFYFSALFGVLFYTPLRRIVEGHYSEIILMRFPILYFFLFLTTSFVMVQYHKSVLDQIDKAEQLQKAKEEADRANKAKSDFLAEMSHEIRTPINAVLGMNEMIRRESVQAAEGGDPEEAFRKISSYSGNIEDAGTNLLSIINDILDFSKIEAGRLELVPNNYELDSLLGDVSSLIGFRVKEKGLEYTLDADEKIPNILFGDKVRVRQIITNLLTNAVKYTDRGSVRMEVRTEEKEYRPGGAVTLVVTVKDTGIGIREADIEKLFTKFQRVDLARNSTVEGTGMGLAITNSLLDMMGGSISVESVYGEGSAFTVRVPQKIVSAEPLGSIRIGEQTGRSGGQSCRESFRAPEARILVVDDTRINLTVTAGLLQKTGIQIDTALSGMDALKMLEETHYDLILMDQRMPGMDGVETLRLLREMQGSPNAAAPVICMTADAIIGARERYTAAGFTDYLPKPMSGETLEKTIVRYLPEEKVTPVRDGGSEADAPDSGEDARYAQLRAAGINTKTGLRYCQHDAALYESLLQEYVQSAKDRMQSMLVYYETRNWKQYGIQVHALKSASRMIGAAELSEKAAAQEDAANREDAEAVRQGYPALAAQYSEVVEAVRQAVGMPGDLSEPEDGIMEFEPEM